MGPRVDSWQRLRSLQRNCPLKHLSGRKGMSWVTCSAVSLEKPRCHPARELRDIPTDAYIQYRDSLERLLTQMKAMNHIRSLVVLVQRDGVRSLTRELQLHQQRYIKLGRNHDNLYWTTLRKFDALDLLLSSSTIRYMPTLPLRGVLQADALPPDTKSGGKVEVSEM